MDTASLAGSLEGKLAAVRRAGFSQVMISAARRGRPCRRRGRRRSLRARQRARASPALEALRDFEGLHGRLHAYKVDVAKSMLEICGATRRAPARSSRRRRRCTPTPSADAIVRDLRMLAVLAMPLGIRIAFKGVSWSRTVRDFVAASELVYRADCPNLGLAIDAFDVARRATFRSTTSTPSIRSRSSWCSFPTTCGRRCRTPEEQAATASHFRVFPGEGAHSDGARGIRQQARCDRLSRQLQLRRLQRRLPADAAGHRGPNGRAARRNGWSKRCCDARCRCPTWSGCGARPEPSAASRVRICPTSLGGRFLLRSRSGCSGKCDAALPGLKEWNRSCPKGFPCQMLV